LKRFLGCSALAPQHLIFLRQDFNGVYSFFHFFLKETAINCRTNNGSTSMMPMLITEFKLIELNGSKPVSDA
jgi:hypothetical protein